MSGVRLESERLRLRPRTLDDLEDCLAMDLDPLVHRYIYLDGPPEPAVHREELRRRISSGWPRRGGLWVVEWRDLLGLLGWCGLFPLDDTGLIEIGYRYVPAAWGQGVASEAGRVVLDHGFRFFGFDPIVAVAHPDNAASRRVLEKLGLRYEGYAHHYGADLPFYRRMRAQYLAEVAQSSA